MVLADRDLRLWDEAKDVRVELQGFGLVVHHHAGQLDAHAI
jgi:hypothetical protein